jgi:hypothetical protein
MKEVQFLVSEEERGGLQIFGWGQMANLVLRGMSLSSHRLLISEPIVCFRNSKLKFKIYFIQPKQSGGILKICATHNFIIPYFNVSSAIIMQHKFLGPPLSSS